MTKKFSKGAIFYANLYSISKDRKQDFCPVLILENHIEKSENSMIVVAPIVTKKNTYRYKPSHIEIRQFTKRRANSVALLEQIIIIDTNRLFGFVDILEEHQMEEVEKILKQLFNEY